MKVLVTGATGFIGSHVVDRLIEKQYDVQCLIRKTSNTRWLAGKKVKLIETSLFDTVALEKALQNSDYIYHIAGNVSAKSLEHYMNGNCQTTVNLMESALKSAPNLQRFLFVSSQAAVGPAHSAISPVTVDTPMNPITDYGRSKKAAEEAVQRYANRLPFTIIRPPAVYGPRETEIYTIFKMIKYGLIPYMGFNNKLLSIVHAFDLSDGIINAAESRNTLGKTYFISSENFYEWKQFYSEIKHSLNKKLTLSVHLPHSIILLAGGISDFFGKFSSKTPVFNYQKGIDFIQQYWICSVKSAIKDFGYRQNMSLEEGIRNTIDWYKTEKWL